MAASAPPRPSRSRAATSPTLAASAIRIGWKASWNCGTPKPNSSWSVDRPISVAPASWTSQASSRSRPGPGRPAAQRPSTSSSQAAIGASEAPPIISTCVGPQSVTSWPKMRCQTSSSGKPIIATPPHSSSSAPPSGIRQPGAQLDRRAVARVGAEHGGEEAGQRDAAEAGEDRVVRDVRERPGCRGRSRCAWRRPRRTRTRRSPSEPSVTSTGSAAQPGTGTTFSASAAARAERA